MHPWIGTIVPWSAPLRSMPQKDALRPFEGVLKDLPRGTQVTVLAQHGAWLNVKVSLGSKTLRGYVSQELVRFVSQGTAETPKPANTWVDIPKPPQALLVAMHARRGADRDNTIAKAQQLGTPSPSERNELLDGLQSILDLAGFIPGLGEIADLVNAGISAMRGNYLEAALSLISLIPGVGDVIGKGAKYALKFADAGMARKVLAALRKADLAGFFKKLAEQPQLTKYIESLRRAVETLTEKLAQLAGEPPPQFAMAGGGRHLPSGSSQNNAVQMSGNLASGYKRGDHVFNNGLTKLGLKTPGSPLLEAAFRKFQKGLKNIEAMEGFNVVVNKGVHAADVNSKLFGDSLAELRNAWSHLNEVLVNAHANAQHRASAVLWATDALKKLRQASIDNDAVLARLREVNGSQASKIKQHIDQAARQLDDVFGGLIKEVEKFMPPSAAVGRSMAGPRGTATLKKHR